MLVTEERNVEVAARIWALAAWICAGVGGGLVFSCVRAAFSWFWNVVTEL